MLLHVIHLLFVRALQVNFMRDKKKESDENAAILRLQEEEAAEVAASLQKAASNGGGGGSRSTTPLRGKAKKEEAKRTFDAALEKHREDARNAANNDNDSGVDAGAPPSLPLEGKVDYCTGKGPFGGDVFQAR